MDRDSLEQLLSEGLSLAAIGKRIGRHEATVAYWVHKHGLKAVNREKHASRGGLNGKDLARLVDQGATIAEIAVALERSKATVRHWLMRHGLKTQNPRGGRPGELVRLARDAGLRVLMLDCKRHGATEFSLTRGGRYRCKQCRSAAVSRRRRKVKAILVREAGGRCCICGYSRSMRALHFHHLDPSQKRHEINARGVAIALDKLRAEARKCMLLCSNCHAEVEDGNVSIPSDVPVFGVARTSSLG